MNTTQTTLFDFSALQRANKTILYLYFIFVVIGLIFIYSISRYAGNTIGLDANAIFFKQFIFALVSMIAMLFFTTMDYRITRVVVVPIFFISLFLLVAVFFPGVGLQVGLARRWIDFRFFSFNPSEFAKIALTIYLAHIFVKKNERVTDFWFGLFPPLILVGIVFGIILLQSGLAIGVIIVLIMGVIIFAGGTSIKHLVYIGIAVATIIGFAIWGSNYRIDRIFAFLDPWEDPRGIGYQSIESLRALDFGGFFGVGLGNSIQKVSRLPAAHTDFIFAIIVEEVGLLGGTALLILYLWFFIAGLKIVSKTQDPYGRLLAFGFVTLIAIHVLLHVMINMGMVPPTGVSLPFISYGGSSFLMLSIAIGILLNISAHIPLKE